ncbi:MAG: 3-oxocholest-4-en-26-oate---CoA ligase [Actinomycetota bacterium]|nr:3-oxocholest-4-en-26-oate---CoA ligase [Actinomycetota bacterium]
MSDSDNWNIADTVEAFARAIPDATAVVQDERRLTWREFDRRADGIAATLLEGGLVHQDRVAQYLYNGPEYLEAFVAATKASLVPVNTNYRYADDELAHLWNDADAAAVVFHGSFTDTVARVRERVATVRVWLWVDDGSGPCPTWAIPYETAAAAAPRAASSARSGSDLVFIYTGGTTGLPKGVMWRQSSIVGPIAEAGRQGPADIDSYVQARVARGPGDKLLPAPPLMHGTGLLAAVRGLVIGGTVVMLGSRRFDAIELWDVVEREQVQLLTIVGDAFARPMLDALDAEPGRWDLGRLRSIMSAGAMFSEPVKRGLLGHVAGLKLLDQLGSSENGAGATSLSRAGELNETGAFRPQVGVRVIGDDGCDVEPGSGRVGVIAIPGGAEGYHKDPAKTAATFPLIEGARYTVAGDHATVEADGSIHFLGRGSVCINTGGEKVFPEEVEEALKSHSAVRDAIVVGLPDERFGEAITAVVELIDQGVEDAELIKYVKSRLARYKAPRKVVRVDSVGRAPNGKVDYPATRALAVERLGGVTTG